MSAKVMFLHLSDIHIKSNEDEVLKRASEIASTTYQRLPEVEAVLIILSGDVAWSGIDSEYKLAEIFLDELKNFIKIQSANVLVDIFVCPGNHDCDFSKSDDTRDAVLSRIRMLEGDAISTSLIKTASSVQESFFNFRDRVSVHKWQPDGRLAWQTSLTVGGIRVGIRCLNVAWMSEIKEKQGALVFPPGAVTPFTFDKLAGLSVTLLHHPFNWFGQSTYRDFQATVRRESHMIFTGHEHFQNLGEISELRNTPSIFIEGGVLFEKKTPQYSNFNIVMVDLKTEQYLAEFYSWNGTHYLAEIDNEEWGSLRALPIKGRPTCDLNADFAATLADAGANFSHSAKKTLLINDIFVWPELLCLDDPGLIKKQVSGTYLENIENLNSGVLISGDEKSGKSTLIRQYFSSYYERGYFPVYFRGVWFTKTHQTESLKALKFALERQYKRTSHQVWLQESKNQKVLFLDDLDSSTLAPQVLSKCLSGLFGYFSAIIVTASDGVAATDLLSIDRVDALSKFTHYKIREFGHKKRFELVCKWAQIGGQEDESSEKWMSTIDKWEKDLTTAVGRHFVPAVPIFLLTLLQSIESGRTADLQNSAFGHYYQFLITSALQNVGIDREQWSEVMNYCANLAWFVHSSGQKHFSENEFENFNTAFSKEFTPVGFERRMRELIKAGLLSKLDGELGFKYPYLYYYFLGQYLADRIHEPEIERVISSLCEDLHLGDNANTLLFTSHHTKSPVIYEKIAASLEQCFETDVVFDFQRDVDFLNKLVDSAPKLMYNEQPTKEARSNLRESQDRTEDEHQTVESSTDRASAVTRLFRGMEILGQFLKNHYGTTKNPIKEELIDKLLQSSLRGLRNVTQMLLEHGELLAEYIERIFSEKRPDLTPDESKAYAKRIVFDLVGMVTYAFIQKAGSSVGSGYLRENLHNVVEANNTLGYALIEMSYRLDLPEAIPFSKLKLLNKSVENNVFSRALLRSMALRHLHLFKVSYKDKQKLCEELDITLNKQLALQNDRASRSRGS